MPLLRLDDDIAADAKLHASKKGYLHKADVKFKKLSLRWCCIRHNVLFVFECESCTKPLYSIFLEGATCKPLEEGGLQRGVTGAFYIDLNEGRQNSKKYLFCACSNQERDEWIDSISCANLTRLTLDLESMKLKCALLENEIAIYAREVELLRQGNQTARDEVSHLRATLSLPLGAKSPRESRHSSKLATPTEPFPDNREMHIRKLQGYIRSWLIHRKWHRVVAEYLESAEAQKMRDRYQILWRFVAAEEDYVSQLSILHEEYQQQCEIAAYSRRPVVTLDQCHTIFRNSEQLLVFHQLFLRGLHSRMEKWPVVSFGNVLWLFLPMTTIYHHFVGNHSHAMEMVQSLYTDQAFKPFLDSIQLKKSTQGLSLEELLTAPLKKITSYLEDLKELKAHTPLEHVDYIYLQETIDELEITQKTVKDGVCILENVRQVLKVEQKIEGGCDLLLDKEQSLIREGILTRTKEGQSRSKTQPMYCFLFSKHLLVTTRIKKTPTDVYRISKDCGILPLAKCNVSEYTCTDGTDLTYVGLRLDYSHGDETDRLIFAAGSTSDKAQWLVDLSQCIESEKQNRILQRLNLGIPVEVSSKFIRYSTLKSGREQVVNCGTLDSLLQRLVRVNFFNLDFLTTMLVTFPLFTNAHILLDFIVTALMENLNQRERQTRPVVRPEEAVKNARTLPASTSAIYSSQRSMSKNNLCVSAPMAYTGRRGSDVGPGGADNTSSIMWIFFVLKQWVTKHFFSYHEDKELHAKLDKLLAHVAMCQSLSPMERIAASELSSLYRMQSIQSEEPCVIIDLMKADITPLPKPYEAVLLWDPRTIAEQLCIIESTLFCRVEAGEILRHLCTKNASDKKAVAPNLSVIFDHFNRMSLFFVWSIAQQRSHLDRTKVLETLIQLASCCLELNNFTSYMQVVSALQHSSVNKFKTAWEHVSKPMSQHCKAVTDIASTTGRFKKLRDATKMAEPPLVPYLGIALNELVGIFEALPTHIEGNLINFSKMRKCSRTISGLLQYQNERYEFTTNEEICKMLLCTPLDGDEDDLYTYVSELEDK